MKSTNIFASLMIVGAVVASGSVARAGEGGAAASVAAQFNAAGDITALSSSVATGKTSAATVARTTATDTYTSAFGTSGALNLAADVYDAGSDADLGTAQANQLSGGEIDTAGVTVELP